MSYVLRLWCVPLVILLVACGRNDPQQGSIAQITPTWLPTEPLITSEFRPTTTSRALEAASGDIVVATKTALIETSIPVVVATQTALSETSTPEALVTETALPEAQTATPEPPTPPSTRTYAVESMSFPEQAYEPPAGVAAELPMNMGSLNYYCQALPDHNLGFQITIYEPVYEHAQGFSMCFSGYQVDQPIKVIIRYPDGSELEKLVTGDPPFSPEALDWVIYPSDPIGEYRVIAIQGEATAYASFTVQPATEPRLIMMPYSGSEAAILPIVLAGFEPFSQQEISLYRSENGVWRYYASLISATIDEQGSFQLNLHTSAGNPSDYYRVVASNLPDHAYPVEFVLK